MRSSPSCHARQCRRLISREQIRGVLLDSGWTLWGLLVGMIGQKSDAGKVWVLTCTR
jgi:hypothetical protein